MGVLKNVIGERYGRLVILERRGVHEQPNGGRRSLVLCRCDCGTEKVLQLPELASARTQSCGCLRREQGRNMLAPLGSPDAAHQANVTHGDARHPQRAPEYRTWRSIVTRCTNPKSTSWKYYGARGISLCEEWRNSYEAFLAHVGRKPAPRLSIDRIDNDGHYEPGNVRWATAKEQAANRRRSGHPRSHRV